MIFSENPTQFGENAFRLWLIKDIQISREM